MDTLTPWKVVVAGIASLILTVGLSRFAYTPMLPVMQAQTWLTDVAGGWLAAINYAGYMTGALSAAALHSLRHKFLLYRIGLPMALFSTAGMGLTQDPVLWAILRFIGGVSSTAGMLLASGLILNWLIRNRHRPELGLHFAGMGLGIVVSGTMAGLMAGSLDWSQQWLMFGLAGIVFLIPAWAWMPAPAPMTARASATTPTPQPDRVHEAATVIEAASPPVAAGLGTVEPPPPGRWLMWSALAYCCAGFGYVVSATFIVAIIESLPQMRGNGPIAWIVVGLAAAPATWTWDRVSRWIGRSHALQVAYLLQIVSILLPAFSGSPLPMMISAALYGITFMGIVSMTLSGIGTRYPDNPARAMATLTLGYGAAQIAAPAITGYMAAARGDYRDALLLAAGVMVVGIVCLRRAARYA